MSSSVSDWRLKLSDKGLPFPYELSSTLTSYNELTKRPLTQVVTDFGLMGVAGGIDSYGNILYRRSATKDITTNKVYIEEKTSTYYNDLGNHLLGLLRTQAIQREAVQQSSTFRFQSH